jgi:DnaJ-class molecular chaperone
MPGTTPKAPDLYQIMGVSRTVDKIVLKEAYRRLARQLHPDATGGDKIKEARFAQVSAAYAILSDDNRRRDYDFSISGSPIAEGGSIFGSLYDQLVTRVMEEGVNANNLDSLIADMLGVAHDVQENLPQRVQAVASQPGSLLGFLERIFDQHVEIRPPSETSGDKRRR